jgi:hypothetical protein
LLLHDVLDGNDGFGQKSLIWRGNSNVEVLGKCVLLGSPATVGARSLGHALVVEYGWLTILIVSPWCKCYSEWFLRRFAGGEACRIIGCCHCEFDDDKGANLAIQLDFPCPKWRKKRGFRWEGFWLVWVRCSLLWGARRADCLPANDYNMITWLVSNCP